MTTRIYTYQAPARRERVSIFEKIDYMSEGKRAALLGLIMGVLLWIPVLLWVAMA